MVSRKAVINGASVENVILAADDFEIAGRTLVAVPNGSPVAPGWTYDGEDFAPPVIAHDMDALKAAAVKTAMDFGNAITGQVTGAYAQAEILSWDKQEVEARIVAAGGTLDPNTSLLPALADDAGQTVEDYAAGVIAKADAFRAIARTAVLLRRQMYAAIYDEAITTPAQLDAVVANLKVTADGIAAQLIAAAG